MSVVLSRQCALTLGGFVTDADRQLEGLQCKQAGFLHKSGVVAVAKEGPALVCASVRLKPDDGCPIRRVACRCA